MPRTSVQVPVSFVFERSNGGWNLVHEHWSPCEFRNEVLTLNEEESTKTKILPIP